MTRIHSSIVFLVALGLSSLSAVQASEAVQGRAKADDMSSCVEPTPVMRRNHFEFIEHQRDLTVHQGIRGSKHSLAGCVDCHARKDQNGQFIPVNAEGQFCDACHDRVAVNIDCFSCHSTIPDKESQ